MNSSFIIAPLNQVPDTAALIVEVRSQGVSYLIIEDKACLALGTFHFNPSNTDEESAADIHQLLAENTLLAQTFKKVNIIYDYTQTVLVPHHLMTGNDNKEMLDLIYGDTKETVIHTDFLYNHLIHNIYRVPAVIESALNRYFDGATYSHLFSLMPDFLKMDGTQLYCIFNTGQLTVMLQKDGKLQLVQQYAYKTPADVAYCLLNICKNFDVELSEVTVHLSGMIDAASALSGELHKYFLNIFFETLPETFTYPDQVSEYPAHYFSHLFAMTACV